MVIFYKKWKKYDEIQLTKNKMDLNNRKITNHPPSPDPYSINLGSTCQRKPSLFYKPLVNLPEETFLIL